MEEGFAISHIYVTPSLCTDVKPLALSPTASLTKLIGYVKADLHGTTLSHAICLRQAYDTMLFPVSQACNLLVIVVCDTKNVVGFSPCDNRSHR